MALNKESFSPSERTCNVLIHNFSVSVLEVFVSFNIFTVTCFNYPFFRHYFITGSRFEWCKGVCHEQNNKYLFNSDDNMNNLQNDQHNVWLLIFQTIISNICDFCWKKLF